MTGVLVVYTMLHTALSLVGLAYGFVVLLRLLKGQDPRNSWTRAFVGLAFLSTFTGFFFPFNGFTPALGTGVVTSAIFALMYVAYRRKLAGTWRMVYVLGLVSQVFFLAFVTIAQAFLKVPSLHALAPTGSEPAFGLAQGVNLAVFLLLGTLVVRVFRKRKV